MRTTVTLDDDVARWLEQHRAERGSTFKQALNEALRAGLTALEAPVVRPARRRTRGIEVGGLLVPSIDDVAEVLSAAEGDDHS